MLTKAESPLDCKQLESKILIFQVGGFMGLTAQTSMFRPPMLARSCACQPGERPHASQLAPAALC